MKKKTYFFLLFIFLTSQMLHSQFENFNEIKESVIPPKPQIKKWTVAIYINGKNNVDMFAFKDFNRIETQGSDENINIVIEIGRAQGF